jgi:hypothetical protein
MANLLYPASTGHYTDDIYSPLVEPNLWANRPFQPGLTYTDKYQIGPAGQIFVHKAGIAVITPTEPGADFSDAIVQDSLVVIALDKQFNRSRKMYGATVVSVAYSAAAVEMEAAIKEVAEAWHLQAFKSLVLTTSILVSDNILTLLAKGTVYDQIVDDRQKMVEAKADPDTIMVSPSIYGFLLQSDEFQRTGMIGDQTVAGGIVGNVAGLKVVEYQSVDSWIEDGDVIGGVTWIKANDELEYVMYDSDAFSIVTSVDATRLVDEPTRFLGILAQVQIVSGYKLTNASRALVKLHDASAS